MGEWSFTHQKKRKVQGFMIWVYVQSEPNLFTVGFYSPDGEWHTDSDYSSKREAAERCAYLNGSKK